MMMFAATFEAWCIVLDLRLRELVGRSLADMPEYVSRCLDEWYTRGLSAAEVAERLAMCRWPSRVTFARFYTDARAVEVRAELMERLAG